MTNDEIRATYAALGIDGVDVLDVPGRPGDTILAAKSGCEVCDFCSIAPVAHVYDTEDIEVLGHNQPGKHFVSEGAWAACAPCHAIVESKDRQALVERSFDLFTQRYGPGIISRKDIREIQNAFWAVHEG